MALLARPFIAKLAICRLWAGMAQIQADFEQATHCVNLSVQHIMKQKPCQLMVVHLFGRLYNFPEWPRNFSKMIMHSLRFL